MFVAVTTPRPPLETQRLFHKCWRGTDEITPAICLEVLRSTNFKTCIYRMLESIDKLPPAKQAEFKEVILNTFHNREQPQNVLELGEKLALGNGFGKEFYAIAAMIDLKEPGYLLSHPRAENVAVLGNSRYFNVDSFCDKESVLFSGDEVNIAHSSNFPPNILFKDNSWVELDYCELKSVENLKFNNNTRASIRQNKSSPKNIEFTNCLYVDLTTTTLKETEKLKVNNAAEVNMTFVQDFSGKLSFNECETVDISDSQFNAVANPVFNEVKFLKAKSSSGFKGNIELKNLKDVNFQVTDLSGVESLKVDNCERLRLNFARNISGEVELNACTAADFEDAKFDKLKTFTARKVENLRLYGNRTLKGALTFEDCNELNLSITDFKEVESVNFNHIRKLDLSYAKNLPAELDFSKCDEIKLNGLVLELSKAKTLIFASRRQYKESGLTLMKSSACDLRFADEEAAAFALYKSRSR